ncbi:MAG TPA: DsbA family protein [Longimicrobiales bacterium]
MAQHQRRPGDARVEGSGSGFKWVLILIAVLGVAGIGYSIWSSKGGTAATGPVTIDPTGIAGQAAPVRKGASNAPVQIVEFADYQCPGCAHFGTNVSRPIREAFVDSGLVRFEYYDYPIYSAHPHAFLAARAARCAGEQDRYWEMHDVLYTRQQQWSIDRTPPVERFVEYAGMVGADAGEFEACLQSDRFADVVTANGMLGDQLGIRSTPTVFINGQNVGEAWSSFEDMSRLIRQQLAAAGATGAASSDTGAAGDTATR